MSDKVIFCELKDKLLGSERYLPVPVTAFTDMQEACEDSYQTYSSITAPTSESTNQVSLVC